MFGLYQRLGVAKIIEVVEVLHHQLNNLGLIADIVSLGSGLTVARSRFEIDDASVSLLSRFSQGLGHLAESVVTLKVSCLKAVLK